MPQLNSKEGILKAARKKHIVIYNVVPTRLSADFKVKLKEAILTKALLYEMIKGLI